MPTIILPSTGTASLVPPVEGGILFSNADNNGNMSVMDSNGSIVDLTATGGGGGATPSLSDTLAIGNTTLDGQTINALNGGGQLDLRYGGDSLVVLDTDSGSYNGVQVYMDHNGMGINIPYLELSSYVVGSLTYQYFETWRLNAGPSYEIDIILGDDDNTLNLGNKGIQFTTSGSTLPGGEQLQISHDVNIHLRAGSNPAIEIMKNQLAAQTSLNTFALGGWNRYSAVFINANNATFNSGVERSVILGGKDLTATTDDTVYVDNLNINTLGMGSSINNLGIDASGNVVVGGGGGGFSGAGSTNSVPLFNGSNSLTDSALSTDGESYTFDIPAGRLHVEYGTYEKFTINPQNRSIDIGIPNGVGGATFSSLELGDDNNPYQNNNTWILPDKSGTIAMLDDIGGKRYVAKLTQTGTASPVATILHNTLGFVPTWTYDSVGFYKISESFTTNTTAVLQGGNVNNSLHLLNAYVYDNDIWLESRLRSTGAGIDDRVDQFVIEITVFD